LRDNSQVYDFVCGGCEEKYQLKSQRRPLGDKFVDSAYIPMIESIKADKAPNLLLLHYDPVDYCAANLVVVPRFFLSASCIEARKPLSADARRAGWVGCNIVLKQLPPDGKIPVVSNRLAVKSSEVRAEYGRLGYDE
jgi:type II restriction enzyme